MDTGYNASHRVTTNAYDKAEQNHYWPDYKVYEIKGYGDYVEIYTVPLKTSDRNR